jgi:hypothetical protein
MALRMVDLDDSRNAGVTHVACHNLVVMSEVRVTFDRHVLGKVVFPEKRVKDPHHAALRKINAALRAGQLQGFICESAGSLEAISPDKRAAYFANRIPKSHIQTVMEGNNISVNITIKTDHDRHPGLDPWLTRNLPAARTLGMRLLYIPTLNVQLPREFLKDQSFYEPRLFQSQAYADRFAELMAAIEARGAGVAVINAIIKRIRERLPVNALTSQSGLQLLPYAKEPEKSSIGKAIAEWADGELVAAHVASSNDLLCSEDRGKSAGGNSVFDDANKAWLMATYGVEIVKIPELAAKLSN